MKVFWKRVITPFIFLIIPIWLSGETLVITWGYPHGTVVTDLVQTYLSELSGLLDSIDFELVYQSNDRSIKSLEYGQSDGDFARSVYVYENRGYALYVPVPILDAHYQLCSSDPSISDDPRSRAGKTLAAVRGDHIMERYSKENKLTNVVLFDDALSVLMALENDRADYSLLPMQVARELQETRFAHSSIIFHPEPMLDVPLYLFLHERHRDILDDITEAMAEMRNSGRSIELLGS